MGKIVYWAIIRIAILIPALWILLEWLEYKYWMAFTALSIYGVVIHPIVIQYKIFMSENEGVINDTLCSSCKHFDETAVLCLKHDQHPTKEELPCDGIDWEVK